jgi:NAD(P)-dependent dehydrogenase (short-subunit alcohol dehydrogenase family)
MIGHNLRKMVLDGKISVVTGGREGVGRGIAAALAKAGARVFVTGRSIQKRAAALQLP